MKSILAQNSQDIPQQQHQHHKSFALPSLVTALKANARRTPEPNSITSQHLSHVAPVDQSTGRVEEADSSCIGQSSFEQYTKDNLPDYVTKDNPKPAIFIARKLLSDFLELSTKKIETTLNHDSSQRNKSSFKLLLGGEDTVHDQLLVGLGAISEFCLPSLLRILLAWYHKQIGTDDNSNQRRPQSVTDTSLAKHEPLSSTANCESLLSQQDCSSPCGNESLAGSLLTNSESAANLVSLDLSSATPTNNAPPSVRSPTSSSPDINSPANQSVSITSTLPLDYQSTSMTILIDPHSSSAVNTSNSTATNTSTNSMLEDSVSTMKRLEFIRRRKLLIEYTFCRALVEIFSQLHLHPGHEDLIGQIEDIAFDHFKFTETNVSDQVDHADTQLLAGKYAEVVGVLAQTRFNAVRKRFNLELAELKSREMTPYNIQCIVTLLNGMRYFRVKMAPIEDFEASFQFLQECCDYFLDTRHKSIKHALAELFVDIMVPLASKVKNEVKIPCLKNFVDCLWSPALDMCSRKKHSTTFFPLVTCLLCVSQRSIFLNNWGTFLNLCLSNLKSRDQKLCRVALESLNRLVWIYMIRVKCESNNITQARLNSIVDAIFARNSRQVNPRDAPLSIFVDMIHFIAQERLDFAMRHIIFELLYVDKPIKSLAPERMNIALQAFLTVVDSLQHKDGDPPMPSKLGYSINSTSSKSTSSKSSSDKKSTNDKSSAAIESTKARQSQINFNPLTFSNSNANSSSSNKMITDDIAKSIGVFPYLSHIQKSFNDILKTLDHQYGKPLLLSNSQNINKEPDDVITSERKPKIDLFKTCISAIPRLMPDGMSKADLIDLLSRMTIHVDEEMRQRSFETLQILVIDFIDWRLDAIEGYTLFIANQIDESLRYLIDNALKMLLQLLKSWQSAITLSGSSSICAHGSGKTCSTVSIQTGYETTSSRSSGATGGQIVARKNRALAEMRLIQSELSNTRFDRLVNVIQKVEAASLVMLCSCHQPTRKIAAHILHESRSLVKTYSTWTCMEHFGFRSPDEADEEDLSASLKGSISADNLSRITATSANGPLHSSVTSMNTQAMLTTSVSRICIASTNNQQTNQHDLYDEDIENNLTDCFAGDDNSILMFWAAVLMLESEQEQEYMLGLRLLRRILPQLPFEQQDFIDEMERSLERMRWSTFPGLHSLVLKGCASDSTYDITIALLDQLTPILKHPICTLKKAEDSLPAHIITLMTHLLSEYDDPSPYSLNMARRIALCCDENSQKLENLSAVMALYSRRSFSKDAFQWIKCVVKYLHDAYPTVLPSIIPLLIDMLERGPEHVQRHVAPTLYCILTYLDMSDPFAGISFNSDLVRLYNKYLNSDQWKDAVQLFKLIISRSSRLADSTNRLGGALPGRIMNFEVDVDSIELIGKSQLKEFGDLDISTPLGAAATQAHSVPVSADANDETTVPAGDSSADKGEDQSLMFLSASPGGQTPDVSAVNQSQPRLQAEGTGIADKQQPKQQQDSAGSLPPRSILSRPQVRERLVNLLMSQFNT